MIEILRALHESTELEEPERLGNQLDDYIVEKLDGLGPFVKYRGWTYRRTFDNPAGNPINMEVKWDVRAPKSKDNYISIFFTLFTKGGEMLWSYSEELVAEKEVVDACFEKADKSLDDFLSGITVIR